MVRINDPVNTPLNIAWDREYKTLEDYEADGTPIYVKPVPADEQASRDRHPTARARLRSPKSGEGNDDGVRLNTADAHRQKAVTELSARIVQAGLELISARGWAAAIGYHNDVRDALTEAIGVVTHIQDLLSIHEDK